MEILLTGATGFVGSHLARKLAEAGHSLRVLYRSPSKLSVLEGLRYQAIQGDLNDRQALERACAGCDILFHVAAKADYWKDDDKDALWRINVDGTHNVLAAAQAAHIKRVIFTSSASTIGIRSGEELATESDRFDLPSHRFWYAYTKVKAEEVVAKFVDSGLDVVTLNPSVIIGPGDLNAISGTFIIQTARFQWALPISSGGVAVIDVRDVAQAHVNAIERGKSGERYLLNTANYPYSEWFKLIAKACGVRPPIFTTPDFMLESTARLIDLLRRMGIETPLDANQARLGSSFVYFNGSKAHRDLFTPQIDIETSLQETWQWYLENGYIRQDILTRLIGLI